jgi:hypothetical protein
MGKATGMTERLGDAPIEPRLIGDMNSLARAVDEVLNGEAKGKDRDYGFILMVFPFNGHEGRANYISNANRADVVTMLKEQLARFEGQPEMRGQA